MLEPIVALPAVRGHIPRSDGYDTSRADGASSLGASLAVLGRVVLVIIAVGAFLCLTLWTAVWLVLNLL